MNSVRQRKLGMILVVMAILAVAAGLILYALRQNISLFYTPTQIAQGEAPLNHPVRVGGMVVQGSVHRSAKDLEVRFDVTDYQHTVTVVYKGILPDLFREGQGIVAMGKVQDNHRVQADDVLAKHDENYMPPEVKAALAKKV